MFDLFGPPQTDEMAVSSCYRAKERTAFVIFYATVVFSVQPDVNCCVSFCVSILHGKLLEPTGFF